MSDVGNAVYDAAFASNPERGTVPKDLLLAWGNSASRVLVDGEAIFTTLADLIAEAEHEVNLATFKWENDSNASNELWAALQRLQARLRGEGRTAPLPVRILVSHVAYAGLAQNVSGPLLREADKRGIDPSVLDLQIATLEQLGRDTLHQKLVVIDNRIAHLGGANVERWHDWYRLAADGTRAPFTDHWRDTAYVLRGPIAAGLRADFAATWRDGETWHCDGLLCSEPNGELPDAPVPPPAADTGDCFPVIALTQRRYENFLDLNYDGIDSAQDAGWLAAMERAGRVLKIQSPNLNDDAARTGIMAALDNGAHVRIILSKGFNDSDQKLPGQGGTNDDNADLLYAEARRLLGDETACDRLHIRWYADEDGRLVVDDNALRLRQSHAKYMSVDDQLIIVGSGNMDTQSWNHSGEVNVAIDDAGVAASYDAQLFDPEFDRAIPTGHCR